MSQPATVDMEAILAPISADLPGGVDPRESSSGSSPYYRAKDARAAARAEERASLDAAAAPPVAWGDVVDHSVGLLSAEAKDLEVAAWLTEALVRTDGFAGLRDGLTVISRLVETYWDHLFPLPDEDGVEGKVAPVAGLSGSGATGTLDRPIRNMPLTQGADGAYSFYNYEQAVELEKITDAKRRATRIDEGAITLDTFKKSIAETPVGELQDTLLTIAECQTALVAMSSALDKVAGVDSPSTSALHDLLAAVGGCLRFVAADRLAALAQLTEAEAAAVRAAEAEAETPQAGDGGGAAIAIRRPGEFQGREEALTALAQIATYFRRTEPHSPMSYTLDDAIRRARLPWPDLLRELAQDPAHVHHILLVAGVRSQEPTDE